MSEIIYVFLSGLWILGLSVILAVLSTGCYQAGENHQPLGKVLNSGKASVFINMGAVLLCAGLAGLAGAAWEKILWGLLGLSFIANMVWERFDKTLQHK